MAASASIDVDPALPAKADLFEHIKRKHDEEGETHEDCVKKSRVKIESQSVSPNQPHLTCQQPLQASSNWRQPVFGRTSFYGTLLPESTLSALTKSFSSMISDNIPAGTAPRVEPPQTFGQIHNTLAALFAKSHNSSENVQHSQGAQSTHELFRGGAEDRSSTYDSDFSPNPRCTEDTTTDTSMTGDEKSAAEDHIIHTAETHFQALRESPNHIFRDEASSMEPVNLLDHVNIGDLQNTPLFSENVRSVLANYSAKRGINDPFEHYGLLGSIESIHSGPHSLANQTSLHDESDANKSLYANLNAPWSTFICGSQGSGKSHTLTCLLENTLLPTSQLSEIWKPLTAMAFHFDKFIGAQSTQVCELAYLCSAGIPVTVLTSPSNIWTMSKAYQNLPGLPANSPRPKIVPLYIPEKHLNVANIASLMAVNKSSTYTPLYLEVLYSILRQMAMEGQGLERFSWQTFKQLLSNETFTRDQTTPLNMRLRLVESFLEPSDFSKGTRPAPSKDDIYAFAPGSLTIVDLSDPFVNEEDACALFTICLDVFMEKRNESARVVALDEAHKFLLQGGEAQALTDRLTTIIRQQRHLGTRIMISTQEPTISPTLLDLCNVTVVHRFLSPAWYSVLRKHLAGASSEAVHKTNNLFDLIVSLKTGEALVFSPTALLDTESSEWSPCNNYPKALGSSYARVRIRDRLTIDGGRSIMATDKQAVNFRPTTSIPMFTPPPASNRTGTGLKQREIPTKPRSFLPSEQLSSTQVTIRAPAPAAQTTNRCRQPDSPNNYSRPPVGSKSAIQSTNVHVPALPARIIPNGILNRPVASLASKGLTSDDVELALKKEINAQFNAGKQFLDKVDLGTIRNTVSVRLGLGKTYLLHAGGWRLRSNRVLREELAHLQLNKGWITGYQPITSAQHYANTSSSSSLKKA